MAVIHTPIPCYNEDCPDNQLDGSCRRFIDNSNIRVCLMYKSDHDWKRKAKSTRCPSGECKYHQGIDDMLECVYCGHKININNTRFERSHA